MHFRQIYFFIIILILGLIITSCEKLVTDPGNGDEQGETNEGITSWGGSSDDFSHAVIQTADNGYAVVGSEYSLATQLDLKLIKFTSEIGFVSDTTYGGNYASYNNEANDMKQTRDGGFIIVGSTYNADSLNSDVWIVKYLPNLTLDWEHTIDGGSYDYGNSIEQLENGNYIVCGTSHDGNDEDIGLWYIDASSAIITDSTIWSADTLDSKDNGTNDVGNYAQQIKGGGYIIVGTSADNTGNNDNIRLIRLDVNNGTLSTGIDTTYNIGSADDEGIYVQQANDNGFVIVGNYWSSGWGQNNIFVLKTDYDGRNPSSQEFGGQYPDFGNCVKQTSDGGYVIVGSKHTGTAADMEDVWVIKLTNDLSVEWSKVYGEKGSDIGNSIDPTSDGGYIVTGDSQSYGNMSQIMLFKIDKGGTVVDFSN